MCIIRFASTLHTIVHASTSFVVTVLTTIIALELTVILVINRQPRPTHTLSHIFSMFYFIGISWPCMIDR